MFAYNRVKKPVIAGPSASENLPRLIGQLQEITRRHQVCYEVSPQWSIFEGRKVQTGFQLQLCGVNHHVTEERSRHPVSRCSHCLQTYQEMRRVAEWILPRDERPSRYEIQKFDHALHMAPPRRKYRNEVIVNIVISAQSDFNLPVNYCESRCFRQMRERLSELGIHEGYWRNADYAMSG